MNILGLHFGHDGSACVIRDGELVAYVSRERQTGLKHCIGVTSREVEIALAEAGMSSSQLDLVTVTSTQTVELLTGLIDGFSIEFRRHPRDATPAPFEAFCLRSHSDIRRNLNSELRHTFVSPSASRRNLGVHDLYRSLCPEYEQIQAGQLASIGCLDNFLDFKGWLVEKSLDELPGSLLPDIESSPESAYGFHYPLTVRLGDVEIPGCFVNHHMAHIAGTYYRSGFADAVIISHDGYSGSHVYHSGMIGFGRGDRVFFVSPHHLGVGMLYDSVCMLLGLGGATNAGKLMGLAPYGTPRFFREEFVGNTVDVKRRCGGNQADAWIAHCLDATRALGRDEHLLGDPAYATDPVNADIAASTQLLFEECLLRAVNAASALTTSIGMRSANLCLTGGTALNCPANSRVYREGPFERMHIEPTCGDDGLSIGSALYAYHHLKGFSRRAELQSAHRSPYSGPLVKAGELNDALQLFESRIIVERGGGTPQRAAEDLSRNMVVGWFEGRSEMGPRALGHRSILAHPGHANNWRRVNQIKGRELWRPFAPAVLEQYAASWFEGAPTVSPYMLFNASVVSSEIPAVTHVDRSARVQTVSSEAGGLYEVLRAFHGHTGIPVVLNTSFNGPAQAIIETPRQALEFLLSTELDVLYIEGTRVTRQIVRS